MNKKNLLLTAFAIVGFATISNAQVPSFVPTNGLVGWWPFNGNAIDESGNGNDGTVNGASLTTDRFGNVNKAYNFNGNNTFIEVPSNSNLQLTNNYSINGWFQANIFFNSGTSDRSIISKVQSSGWYDGYEVMVGGTTNDIAHVGNVGGNNFVLGSTGYLINTWYMFTVTYNGNTMNLFMNGELVNTQPTSGNLQTGSLPLRFGMRDGSIQYFDGKIDDMGIWNRTLTTCEIQDLYSSQLNSTFVSAGIDQTICNGDQVTLTATGSQNYNWSNGVVNGSPFTPTNTSDYIVTADSAGCQSADTISVTINQPTNSTLNETALDTYTLNGQTYTQSGIYTQIIPNSEDCDSTITLNLTMNYTGINEVDVDLISVSPNPSTGILNIQVNENLIGTKFYIHDEVGREISMWSFNSKITEIDLTELSSGIYFLKTGQNLNNTIRIIKVL